MASCSQVQESLPSLQPPPAAPLREALPPPIDALVWRRVHCCHLVARYSGEKVISRARVMAHPRHGGQLCPNSANNLVTWPATRKSCNSMGNRAPARCCDRPHCAKSAAGPLPPTHIYHPRCSGCALAIQRLPAPAPPQLINLQAWQRARTRRRARPGAGPECQREPAAVQALAKGRRHGEAELEAQGEYASSSIIYA